MWLSACACSCLRVLQLRAAEELRDDVRAERDRLVGREAAVTAAESGLATRRREMERQAAEIEQATQVCVVRLLAGVAALW